MIVGWFLTAAILLVAFGGLMAAVDAAIVSQSRANIAELAVTARSKRSLRAIAADTGAHLNALYSDLLASGRRDGKGGLSPATVRYVHAVIRKALAGFGGERFSSRIISGYPEIHPERLVR